MTEYDREPAGMVSTIRPGVRRILAPNPSAMTYRGTNSYLVGVTDIAVIDPGPDDPAHLAALLGALAPGQRIRHILVTHAHRDHSALAPRLADVTGAPVLAFGAAGAGRTRAMSALAGAVGGGEGIDTNFRPDRRLADGEVVEADALRIQAIWTPGHMSSHLCYAYREVLFSGDLVMGWASTLISPPDGDLDQFLDSCLRLSRREESFFLPGHGPALDMPQARCLDLIAHREARHAQLLAALSDRPQTIEALAARVYTDLTPTLRLAAQRNVLAHLAAMVDRGEVKAFPTLAPDAKYIRCGKRQNPRNASGRHQNPLL